MSTQTFHAVDYVVFGVMLLISAAIGIYHGCTGGKQRSTSEYLLGNRSMNHFPIAISLLVSYLSAISLMGIPGEVFTFGAQYMVIVLSYFILIGVTGSVFVPIYYNLRITSAYEYLEMRFSPGVRVLGAIMYIVRVLFIMAIVMYAPALALDSVAGIPLTASIISTGVVCTFYTTLGGLKAVVWTDVFQAFVMVTGLITVLIVGTVNVGGLDKVWQINKERGRLNVFDFDPNPATRNTFWTLTIGGAFTILPSWATGQTNVQRFLASKNMKSAKRALWLNIPLLTFVVILCSLDGLVIFATYAECDLKASKRITRNDQVLPFFVIDKLGHLRGIPGLFVACLFSGALSSASSGINSLVTVVLEDIVKKRVKELTDYEATRISKVLAIIFGVLIIGGAFAVKYAGTMVLQLAFSLTGALGGPLFGIFVLVVLLPRANYKGAYAGILAGVGLNIWIVLGAIAFPPDKKPGSVSIKECSFYNATTYANKTDNGIISKQFLEHSNPLAKLYSLSYLWYGATGMAITVVFGAIISIIFESDSDRSKPVRQELLFDVPSFLKSLLPTRKKSLALGNKASKQSTDKETYFPQEANSVPLEEISGGQSNVVVEHCTCEKQEKNCAVHFERAGNNKLQRHVPF